MAFFPNRRTIRRVGCDGATIARVRWLYADPNSPEERRQILDVSRQIDAWWREFGTRTADLDALFHGKAAIRGNGHRLVSSEHGQPESDGAHRGRASRPVSRAATCPVIIESVIEAGAMEREVNSAIAAFEEARSVLAV